MGFPFSFEGSHVDLLVYRFFCLFFEKKKMFTLPSLKKKFKRQKKKRGGFKRCFLSLGKEQHLAMFLFSIPVLTQRAWFSGKPSPVKQKQTLVVSHRKKETPSFSTDTMVAL